MTETTPAGNVIWHSPRKSPEYPPIAGMLVMPFVDRCSHEFEPEVQSRGRRYYQEGRVQIASEDGQSVLAIVQGASGDYEVRLDWTDAGDGFVEASCTCPYFDERRLCKHIWATMLAADTR